MKKIIIFIIVSHFFASVSLAEQNNTLSSENDLSVSSDVFSSVYNCYDYRNDDYVRYSISIYKNFIITEEIPSKFGSQYILKIIQQADNCEIYRLSEDENINIRDIEIYDDFLFLNYEDKLRVFDLSGLPSSPPVELNEWDGSLVSNWDFRRNDNSPYFWHGDWEIRKKYLYEVYSHGESEGKLNVYDISDLSKSNKLSTLDIKNGKITIFKIIRDKAYIIWEQFDDNSNAQYNLSIYKISNFTEFKKLETYKFSSRRAVLDIDFVNGYLVISNKGLVVLDVLNPLNIKEIASFSELAIQNFESLSGFNYAVAFVWDCYSPKFSLLNISNIEKIEEINYLNLTSTYCTSYPAIKYYPFDFAANDEGAYLGGFITNDADYDDGDAYWNLKDLNLEIDDSSGSELLSLRALRFRNKIKLKFQTVFEKNINGILIIKKRMKNSNLEGSKKENKAFFKKVMDRKILPKGRNGKGASYNLIDKKVKKGKTYRYLFKYLAADGKKYFLRKIDVTLPQN